MNPQQKAARAYLKRKMSAGAGGIGGGVWLKPPKPPELPLKMRARREVKTGKPPTFEDDVRARAKAMRLSESLARSKKPGTS